MTADTVRVQANERGEGRDMEISGQELWLALGAPEVAERDEPPMCKKCDTAYAIYPVYGPDMCEDCEKAAWERIDAAAAKHGPSTPGTNVWD